MSESPYYTTGYSVSIALLLFTGIMSTVMFLGLITENKKRSQGKRDYRLQEEDADNLGDDDPRFKFAY